MEVLKFIWMYLVILFPFGVVSVMGFATSELVKIHFCDRQKYKMLRELQWISYADKKVEASIEKEWMFYFRIFAVCVILLFANFALGGEANNTVYIALGVVFLMGLGGGEAKKPTSMKAFIEEYKLDIEYEELRSGTAYTKNSNI